MFQWLFEAFVACDKSYRHYLVKAETYGAACALVGKHEGACDFRLLGQFEQIPHDSLRSRFFSVSVSTIC